MIMDAGDRCDEANAVTVYIYVDVPGLQNGYLETCGVTKSETGDDPDGGHPIDIGYLVASILGKIGLGTNGESLQINVYGAAPSTTDTIRRSVPPLTAITSHNGNPTSGHVPRPAISMLCDSVMRAVGHFHNGGRAIFVLVCDEFDDAVRTIAERGFDAHVWCWRMCLPEDYKSVREDHVHIHTIDDYLQFVTSTDDPGTQYTAST